MASLDPKREPINAAAFGEVEGHRARASDVAPVEVQRPRSNDVDKLVQVTDGFEKPWTDLVRVEGLAEVDVGVGYLVVLEMG